MQLVLFRFASSTIRVEHQTLTRGQRLPLRIWFIMIVERVNTAGGLSASRAGSSPLWRCGRRLPPAARLPSAPRTTRVPQHCSNDPPPPRSLHLTPVLFGHIDSPLQIYFSYTRNFWSHPLEFNVNTKENGTADVKYRVVMNNYERYHKCILEILQKLLEPVRCGVAVWLI